MSPTIRLRLRDQLLLALSLPLAGLIILAAMNIRARTDRLSALDRVIGLSELSASGARATHLENDEHARPAQG